MKKLILKLIPRWIVNNIEIRRMFKRSPLISPYEVNQTYQSILQTLPQNFGASMKATAGSFTVTANSSQKYSNVAYWLRDAIIRCKQLGLDGMPPRHILDLGCGSGLFMATCQYFGHDAEGVDLPFEMMDSTDPLMYKKSCNLLGVESFIRREPITPSFHHISKGEGIDLITAFMIRFYRHPDGSYWNSSSWQTFLKRFLDILAPEGSCYLQFNPEPDVYSENNFVDTETNSFFQRIGSFERGVLKINRQQLQEFYEI